MWIELTVFLALECTKNREELVSNFINIFPKVICKSTVTFFIANTEKSCNTHCSFTWVSCLLHWVISTVVKNYWIQEVKNCSTWINIFVFCLPSFAFVCYRNISFKYICNCITSHRKNCTFKCCVDCTVIGYIYKWWIILIRKYVW